MRPSFRRCCCKALSAYPAPAVAPLSKPSCQRETSRLAECLHSLHRDYGHRGHRAVADEAWQPGLLTSQKLLCVAGTAAPCRRCDGQDAATRRRQTSVSTRRDQSAGEVRDGKHGAGQSSQPRAGATGCAHVLSVVRPLLHQTSAKSSPMALSNSVIRSDELKNGRPQRTYRRFSISCSTRPSSLRVHRKRSFHSSIRNKC